MLFQWHCADIAGSYGKYAKRINFIFRHVAVLKLVGREMKIEKIPLLSVRQMYVETIVLSEVVKKLPSVEATEKAVQKYCKKRVEALLKEASQNRSGHRDQPVKPLIRLRVKQYNH